MRISDWSSDVCSSDLQARRRRRRPRTSSPARSVGQTHLRERFQASVANVDRTPDPADQRIPPRARRCECAQAAQRGDGKVLFRSEEHTSELQSLMRISYAVCCLKKNKTHTQITT